MVHDLTTPAWAPVFHDLIRRLKTPAKRPVKPLPGMPRSGREDIAFEDQPIWPDDADQNDPDQNDGGAETDDDEFAPEDAGLQDIAELDSWAAYVSPSADVRSAPAPRPDFPQVFAALQIAMSCNNPARLYRSCEITVMRSGCSVLTSALTEVIKTAVMPFGKTVVTCASTRLPEGSLVLLTPSGDSSAAQKTLVNAIRDALGKMTACLVLLPDSCNLPQDLAQTLPATVTPPSLDHAALYQLLCVQFPEFTEQVLKALTRQVPEDADLADLSLEQFSIAFRTTNPKSTITTIKRFLQKPVKTAPPTSSLQQFDPEQPAVRAAHQAVADLDRWRAGKLAWSDIPNGLLFYGPPGTGKTWLARALANAAAVPMVETSFAKWQEGTSLGPVLMQMRESFDHARRMAPCVFFIDEIDALGTREERNHNSSYNDKITAAFLTGIAALRDVEGVILVGATNRVDGMDAAALRPGRFDLKLHFGPPSRAGVRLLLKDLLVKDRIPQKAKDQLAEKAFGLSAAEITGAVRTARAEVRGSGTALATALAKALTRGIEVPEALRQRIAVHEAGHALVGIRLGLTISRITLTQTGGQVTWINQPTAGLLSELEAEIAVAMAGRAAEEVLLGSPSSGSGRSAESDLARATQIAHDIEARCGLGSSGLIWRGASPEAYALQPQHAARLEHHVGRGLATAKALISQMPLLVEAVAEVLLREGDVSGDTLQAWVTTIRDYDPDLEEEATGAVLAFPPKARSKSMLAEPDQSA